MTGMRSCANYLCVVRGCSGACKGKKAKPDYPWSVPISQRGCICPPTSEQTCLRKDCGRKDPQPQSEI